MSEWEQELQRTSGREEAPPSMPRQQSRLGVANRNRQRRAEAAAAGDAGAAASSSVAASAQGLRPLQAQRPFAPPQDDDPFAVHDSPPPSAAAQQPFVHPLMAEPLRVPSHHQQQQQAQSQQYESERDPSMRRIESTLRSTLDRPAASGTKQLPPLQGGGRPTVPPLRLGDVINKVLGPRALTNPTAAPAASQEHRDAERLRAVVRNMRLHESVNPALSGQNSAYPPGMDAEEIARIGAFIDDGPPVEYDENDDESIDGLQHPAAGGAAPLSTRHAEYAQHDDEKRPLSPGSKAPRPPREPLPTSRLPIQPEDLARRPEELIGAMQGREGAAARDELMHFRVNQPVNGGGISNTTTGGPGVTGIMSPSVGNTGTSGTGAKDPDVRRSGAFGASQRSQPTEAFVESKTTGEFIRVRKAPNEHGSGFEDGHGATSSTAAQNVHNLSDFDAQIDTILDHVNGIQAFLNCFWLLVSGLLVGVCLLQVYMVYLKTSDVDFLSYYSAFAGPARKVVYVLLGFSVTLSLWRYSLERHDGDRHAHFISRYHVPNSSGAAWWRNVVCAGSLSLAFLLTLIMVPVEDYMERRWADDAAWFATGELDGWFSTRITHWYAMSLVRLLCVSIAWLCIVARFGGAEHWYLALAQEKAERRMGAAQGAYPALAPSAPLSRTSRSAAMGQTGGYGYGGEPSGAGGGATARTSRVSSHAPLHATSNSAALRMDSTHGSTMMVPPRR